MNFLVPRVRIFCCRSNSSSSSSLAEQEEKEEEEEEEGGEERRAGLAPDLRPTPHDLAAKGATAEASGESALAHHHRVYARGPGGAVDVSGASARGWMGGEEVEEEEAAETGGDQEVRRFSWRQRVAIYCTW